MKAAFIRSLVIRKLESNLSLSRKDLITEIYIGYEGLDAEIWFLRGAQLRYMLIKRQGYKSFNTHLSHDVTNHIRDNLLKKMNHYYYTLERAAHDHFFDPEALAEVFIKSVYSKIIEDEKKIISHHGNKPERFVY